MEEEQKEFFDSFKGVLRLNIPVSLFKDKSISIYERQIYEMIDFLSRQKGYCWATNGTLAEILGISQRTITRSLSKLEEKGYIKKEIKIYKGQTRRKVYTMNTLQEVYLDKNRTKISSKDIELSEYDWLNEEES